MILKHINIVRSQACPTGIVNEDTFKEIYGRFFPQGGWCVYNKITLLYSYEKNTLQLHDISAFYLQCIP